jgi:predicted transcriptional regulator
MSESTEERGPPETDFSESLNSRLRNAPADERVYRVALGLTGPTSVADVAERADCSKNAARRHLKRFVDIGILTRVTENPETFERNESYFEWRRLNRLAELSEQEYKERLGELLTEDESYCEKYDTDDPDKIDPLTYGEYGDAERVWLEINNWQAIREEVRDLHRVHRDTAREEGVV